MSDKMSDKDIKITEKILRLINENLLITTAAIAEQCNITIDGVDYHIKKLKAQGLLIRVGGKNGGHWEVKEK